MATTSLADFPVTGTWKDVTVTLSNLASADAIVANVGNAMVFVVSGGSGAPTTSSGVPLAQYHDTYVNSDHIWVRTLGPDGKLAVNLL